MRRLLLILGIFMAFTTIQAQFANANYRLSNLKKKSLGLKSIKKLNLEDKKFVLIKDFSDHTERLILSVSGDKATFVEVFDDKALEKSSSNVFSGDWIKTDSGVLSFRFDRLEDKPLPLPVAKNFIVLKENSTLVLVDVNTKDRWIGHESLIKP